MTETVIHQLSNIVFNWNNSSNSKHIRTTGSSSKSYCKQVHVFHFLKIIYFPHIYLRVYSCKEDGKHCSSIPLTSIKEAICSSRVFPLKGCLIGPKTQPTIIIMSDGICSVLGITSGKALICLCLSRGQ